MREVAVALERLAREDTAFNARVRELWGQASAELSASEDGVINSATGSVGGHLMQAPFLRPDLSSMHEATLSSRRAAGRLAVNCSRHSEFVEKAGGRLSIFSCRLTRRILTMEWVWNNLKNDRIGRSVIMSAGDLKAKAIGALRRLQKLPAVIRGFLRDPKLAYILELHKRTSREVCKLIFFLISVVDRVSLMPRFGLGLAAGPGLLPGSLEPHHGTTGASPYRQVGQSPPP